MTRGRRLATIAAGLLLIVSFVVLLARSGSRPTVWPVRSHVETWAYVDSPSPSRCNGGWGASSELVRAWVTDAETNCGPWRPGHLPPALRACHVGRRRLCMVVPYVDTSLVYRATPPGRLLQVAAPSWFAQAGPGGSRRVTTRAFGGGYLMNEDDAGYRAWWRAYVRRSFPGADALFMDDQSPEVPFIGLSAGHSRQIGTEAALRSAHQAMADALTRPDGRPYPQIDNTIQDCGNPALAQPGVGPAGSFLAPPVTELLAEGCPIDDGVLTSSYAGLLDDAAAIVSQPAGALVLLAYGRAGAAYAQRERRVVAATDLLVYSPGRIIVWPDLEQGTRRLAIWPEEGLYPTRPRQTMRRPRGRGCLTGSQSGPCPSGGHADLEVPDHPGVLRREFGACADRGREIGRCAALVNTTSRPVVVQRGWLTGAYRTVITFSRRAGTTGDVQSGGRLNLSGAPFAPGTTVLGAQDALLLSSGSGPR